LLIPPALRRAVHLCLCRQRLLQGAKQPAARSI